MTDDTTKTTPTLTADYDLGGMLVPVDLTDSEKSLLAVMAMHHYNGLVYTVNKATRKTRKPYDLLIEGDRCNQGGDVLGTYENNGLLETADRVGVKFKIMRDCCTSGNCLDCAGKTKFGVPMRVMQSGGLTLRRAQVAVQLWHSYKATVEPMFPAV